MNPAGHDVIIPASAGTTTALAPSNPFGGISGPSVNTVTSEAELLVSNVVGLDNIFFDADLSILSDTNTSTISRLVVDGGRMRLATSAGDINDNALTLPNGGLLTNGGQIEPIDFNPPGGKMINQDLFETFTEPAGGPRSRISIAEFENQGTVSMTGAGINVGASSTFINKQGKLWDVNVQELTGGGNLFLNPLIAPRFINEQDATLDVTTANGAEAAVISMVNDQGKVILHNNSGLFVGTGNAGDLDRPERRSEFKGGTVQFAPHSRLVVGAADFFPAQLTWTGGATAFNDPDAAFTEDNLGEIIVEEFGGDLVFLHKTAEPLTLNTLDGVKLRNDGSVFLRQDGEPDDDGAEALWLKGNAQVINQPTGTLTLQNASIAALIDGEMQGSALAAAQTPPAVNDQGGTVVMEGGVSKIQVPFHMSESLLHVKSGDATVGDQRPFPLPNDHTGSGVIRVDAGATLLLNTTNTFDGNFALTGGGTVTILDEANSRQGAFIIPTGSNMMTSDLIGDGVLVWDALDVEHEVLIAPAVQNDSQFVNETNLHWKGGSISGFVVNDSSTLAPGISGFRVLDDEFDDPTGKRIINAIIANYGKFSHALDTKVDYITLEVINGEGAEYTLDADAMLVPVFVDDTGASGLFTNRGTLTVEPGAVLRMPLMQLNGVSEFRGELGTVTLAGNITALTVAISGGRLDMNGGVITGPETTLTGGTVISTDGTIDGNVVNSGADVLVQLLVVDGDYHQETGGSIEFTVFNDGTTSDSGNMDVVGMIELGGELRILGAFDDGVPPLSPTESFTVITSFDLSGVFDNVTASGNRVPALDATGVQVGSFAVHFGPTSAFHPNDVVLTGFLADPVNPIPEPGTLGLLLLASIPVFHRRQRTGH